MKLSISERMANGPDVPEWGRRNNRIVLSDSFGWEVGKIHNENQLKEVLDFLGIEMTYHSENKNQHSGVIKFYTLSKGINNSYPGGFWNLEQLKEVSKGKELKKIKGLSNGSLVDCYVEVNSDEVNIYRPNPNAKEVYVTMSFEDEVEYKRKNWYL